MPVNALQMENEGWKKFSGKSSIWRTSRNSNNILFLQDIMFFNFVGSSNLYARIQQKVTYLLYVALKASPFVPSNESQIFSSNWSLKSIL